MKGISRILGTVAMEMGSSTGMTTSMSFPEQVINKMTTQCTRNDGAGAAIQLELTVCPPYIYSAEIGLASADYCVRII